MANFFKNQTIEIYQDERSGQPLLRTKVAAVNDNTIYLYAHDARGGLMPFAIGSSIKIYFARPDAFYSLETQVVDKLVSPEPILVLDRDDSKLERLQRRRYFRVNIRVKVIFAFMRLSPDSDDLKEETTYTRNLSAGGMFCALKTACQVGDHVQIHLFLPGETNPMGFGGTVVRVAEGLYEQGAVNCVGISFQNIEEAERSRLTSFLFRVQRSMIR